MEWKTETLSFECSSGRSVSITDGSLSWRMPICAAFYQVSTSEIQQGFLSTNEHWQQSVQASVLAAVNPAFCSDKDRIHFFAIGHHFCDILQIHLKHSDSYCAEFPDPDALCMNHESNDPLTFPLVLLWRPDFDQICCGCSWVHWTWIIAFVVAPSAKKHKSKGFDLLKLKFMHLPLLPMKFLLLSLTKLPVEHQTKQNVSYFIYCWLCGFKSGRLQQPNAETQQKKQVNVNCERLVSIEIEIERTSSGSKSDKEVSYFHSCHHHTRQLTIPTL